MTADLRLPQNLGTVHPSLQVCWPFSPVQLSKESLQCVCCGPMGQAGVLLPLDLGTLGAGHHQSCQHNSQRRVAGVVPAVL